MADVLTNIGEEWAAGRMAGTDAADAHFIGWGTGAGVAAKADTGLFTEASEARVAGAVTLQGAGAAAKYQVVGTLTANANKTITNAGSFKTVGGADCVVHSDFAGIALNNGDSIQFTITIDPS